MRINFRKKTRALLPIAAAALFGTLCLAAVALGAEQSDPAFGTNGVARLSLPQKAARAEVGIWDLANAPEGKMAAALGGESTRYGYFGAARLNEDGSIDKSFGSEGFTADYEVPALSEPSPPPFESTQKTQAQAVAVQADGKVVVAGYFELESFNHIQSYAPVLARYGTDGLLDPSFGAGGVVAPADDGIELSGRHVLHAIAIAPSGRIIAVGARGESRYENFQEDLAIAYTPEGQLDRSFGHRGRVRFPHLTNRRHPATKLTAVKVLHSGKVLLGGYLLGRLLVARLTANGKFDPSFGGGDGKVSLKIGKTEEPVGCCGGWASLALRPGGKILLAGTVNGHRGEHLALARFRADGTLDKTFGKGGLVARATTLRLPYPRDVAVQGDGAIVVAGLGRAVAGGEPEDLSFRALRYLPDGKLDRSFGEGGLQLLHPGIQNGAKAALTQASGRVVAGGSMLSLSGKNYESELLLSRYLVASAG